MKKHFVVALTSYFASLIWSIMIFILLLEKDILLFVIIYLLTIFPLLLCAAGYTYKYAGQNHNAQWFYKHFLLYFIGFTIPIFNVILCIIYLFEYQDLEEGTLRTIGYSGLFLILFIIAVSLSYPEIPSLYFMEVFINPSKN